MTTELVERAQRGDHEAFEALATAAYHRLYAIASRILRDGYGAEDAVQDALVHAWRDVRGLRDPGAFDAWLQRLLINACYDQTRRRRRRPVEVHSLPLDHSRPVRQSFEGAVVKRRVDAANTARLRALCRAQDATLFMVLHTAFAVPMMTTITSSTIQVTAGGRATATAYMARPSANSIPADSLTRRATVGQ